jgi:hypothetical protein
MLLTKLAENVQQRLNDNRDQWAPETKAVKAEVCIDWVTAVCSPGFKVLVIPELNQYLADDSNSREWVKKLQITKYLSIIVGYTFEEPTYNDTIATWEESSFILDTRERIEIFLLSQSYEEQKLLITDIESQPVNEQELDRRNFNAITSIGFDQLLCSTPQESNSLSLHSNEVIESAERRASMRRAALSAQRLGRR